MPSNTVLLPKDELAALRNEAKSLKEQSVKQTAQLEEMRKALSAPASKTGLNPGQVFATARDAKEEGRCGFKSMTHQLHAIKDAKLGRANEDTLNMLNKVTQAQEKA